MNARHSRHHKLFQKGIKEETRYKFSGIDAPKNENDLYGLRCADFIISLVKGMLELMVYEKNKFDKCVY